ncbi:13847_t:CDS:2 [Acaulospora morrowiae]|uniref:13847_t:CDS:1 n=1 Tax=Acaulospora morrowiae TaxID=94023 RepID=A0A9N9GJ45_9GLOM|nr:13847_t:CDS:2 [Acaulospora morrowiae]
MSKQSGPITCHVLDSSRGIPGKNIEVQLEQLEPGEEKRWNAVSRAITNEDGRCPSLVPSDYKIKIDYYDDDNTAKALYRITFYTAPYFKALNQKSFYPFVQVFSDFPDN